MDWDMFLIFAGLGIVISSLIGLFIAMSAGVNLLGCSNANDDDDDEKRECIGICFGIAGSIFSVAFGVFMGLVAEGTIVL